MRRFEAWKRKKGKIKKEGYIFYGK